MADDTIPVTVYVSPSLKKKVDKECRTRGYSVTGYIRVAIEQRLVSDAELYDSETLSRAVSRT